MVSLEDGCNEGEGVTIPLLEMFHLLGTLTWNLVQYFGSFEVMK